MSKQASLPINGILLVNKPQGLSSNKVLQKVKNIFSAQKAGHTGSLDPLATGMLPICFGEATKFCQYLLDADKCYETSALLGVKTNTGDATGEITCKIEDFSISKERLQKTLLAFEGSISQIPSMFSALKHQGQPLYKLARQGIEVERKAREIVIHQMQLNQFEGSKFDLTVTCSKGTYIRNLIEDIGDSLAVGAHVTRLHRRYTMGFESELMYTIDELVNKDSQQRLQCLLPLERAVSYLPKMIITQEDASSLRQGKVILVSNNQNFSGNIRLYEKNEYFIGLGEIQSSGVLKVKRLLTPCAYEKFSKDQEHLT